MALLPYLDVVLVLIAAAVALAAGAPELGIAVGAAAWIVVRLISAVVDRRLESVENVRHRLGLAVAYKMGRVWMLACAIIAVGATSERAEALATALVIFGAFSVYFACSAVVHAQRKRMSA